jgi:hypothetical protein
MPSRAWRPARESRDSGEARFVLTPEASFFVPGTIPGRRVDGEPRRFRIAAMRGEFLGRPIVTIPREEAE